MRKFFGKCGAVALNILVEGAIFWVILVLIGGGLLCLAQIKPEWKPMDRAAEHAWREGIEEERKKEAEAEVDRYLAEALQWHLTPPDMRKDVVKPEESDLRPRAKKELALRIDRRSLWTNEGRWYREQFLKKLKEEKTPSRKELAQRTAAFLQKHGWFFAAKDLDYIHVMNMDAHEMWSLQEMITRLNRRAEDAIMKIAKDIPAIKETKLSMTLTDYGVEVLNYKINDGQERDRLYKPMMEVAQHGNISLKTGVWSGSHLYCTREKGEATERSLNGVTYGLPALLPEDEEVVIAIQVAPTIVRVTLSKGTLPNNDRQLRRKIAALAAVAGVKVTDDWRWTTADNNHDLYLSPAK